MLSHKLLLSFSLLCAFVSTSHALDNKADLSKAELKILVDYPEFLEVVSGKRQAESVVELTNMIWIEALNLEGNISYLPTQRVYRELDTDTPVCSIFKIKTPERAKQYLFSLPTDVFLAPRLYQLKSSKRIEQKHLNESGAVKSLTEFFNDPSTRSTLTLLSGKTMGDELDKQISNISIKKLSYINANQPYESYLKLLENKRTDFILAFPSIISLNEYLTDHTFSYAIENIEEHVSGRVMCNKHPKSEAIIAKINHRLIELYNTPAFLNALTLNVSQSERELVRDIIEQSLKTEGSTL